MSKGGRRVRIFSALEVANICGVVNQTAINWIRSGHLKAFTTPGGQYRIYAKDLAAFLDKRGMSASGDVLQDIMENANWNTILIAMEQFQNDQSKADLEHIFPEHTIVQAFDWFEVGMKIIERKPGIILLDEALPGVDVNKFFHTVRNDPSFGRPFICLLREYFNEEASQPQADLVLTKPLDLGAFETAIKNFDRTLDRAVNTSG